MEREAILKARARAAGVYKLGMWVTLFITLGVFSIPLNAASLFAQFGCEGVLARINRNSSGYTLRNDHIVIQGNLREFKVFDQHYPILQATGTLDKKGGLFLDLSLRNPDPFDHIPERSPYLRGREVFDAVMEHFGTRVKIIYGSWTFGDNLERFNDLRSSRMSSREAAAATWTGQQAARYNFTRIAVSTGRLRSPPFKNVNVKFYPALKAK